MKNLSETIYKRKSHREYFLEKEIPLTVLNDIEAFWKHLTPLYPEIRTEIVIHTEQDYELTRPWAPKYAISLYSEKKEGYLENAGFLLQLMDLYLQSRGLGACWLGLSKPNSYAFVGELEFVILLAFGYSPCEMRKNLDEFKRKTPSEIADSPDEKLEPARFSPSAINSQPWYFIHENEIYHLYRSAPLQEKGIDYLSQIDSGIALAHLYVSNPDSFRYLGSLPEKERDDLIYVGSFTL